MKFQVTKAEVPTQSAIYKHVELDQVGANIEKAKPYCNGHRSAH